MITQRAVADGFVIVFTLGLLTIGASEVYFWLLPKITTWKRKRKERQDG